MSARLSGVAHVDIDGVGQGDGAHHGPQPLLQSVAAGEPSAHDAAQHESDESHGAVGQSELLRRQSQSALGVGALQEGEAHLRQQGLGETVEQQEEHGEECLAGGELPEVGGEHGEYA